MAKIIVYNDDTNQMETYYREENEPMPYNTHNSLSVGEFARASDSPTIWTTKGSMQSWNGQRELFGQPINVGYAFRRPWEGGHANQSQHYAGTAFDVGQGWTNEKRASLRSSATNSGLWVYVEPVSISPTWVHFDKRELPPACSGGGYPMLRLGSIGVYVLIAQDGLNTLGYGTGGLDGVFGLRTMEAVTLYQANSNLGADGVIGCSTWRALQEDVVGGGSSATTLDY